MGRPRQISDEQILAAMREGVRSKGSRVSLEVVAAALDVSVPAILKRFGSRDALMVAALKPPDPPDWVEEVQKGPEEGPLEGQLAKLFSRLCAFMTQAMPCVIALRESGIPVERWLRPHAPQRDVDAVHCWLSLARKRGLVLADELEASAVAMIGAVQSRAFLAHLLKKGFPEKEQRAYVRDLARVFSRALSSSTPSSPPLGNHHDPKSGTPSAASAASRGRVRQGRRRKGPG
jgi:AcrR family transcriptional regulator